MVYFNRNRLQDGPILLRHLLTIVIFIITWVFLIVFKQIKRRKKERLAAAGTFGIEEIPLGYKNSSAWFFGNLAMFVPLNQMLKFAEQNFKLAGPVLRFNVFHKKIILLNSAQQVEYLLKSTDLGHASKGHLYLHIVEPYLNRNSVGIASGKSWQAQRKILQKSQNYSVIKHHMSMICWHSLKFVGSLENQFVDENPKQIFDIVKTAFSGIILEVITGYRSYDSEQLEEYHQNLKTFLHWSPRRMLNPFINLIWWAHPGKYKLDTAVKRMNEFTRKLIFAYQTQRSNRSVKVQVNYIMDDLIDQKLDDEKILIQVNTFLFAGIDTGSSVFHFFCFMMALNPYLQTRCQSEVDSLFASYPAECCEGQMTLSMTQNHLEYLERCILETLRLFPPGYVLSRELTSPLQIQTEGKTIEIPVGTNVAYSPYLLHRNAEYFPEPEKFDPDRFFAEVRDKRPSHSYVPFSAGIRNCIGNKFAIAELKVLAAYTLRNFCIETTEKMEDVHLIPDVTLMPEKDMHFIFKKRL